MAQFVQNPPFDEAQFYQAQGVKNARLGLLLWRIANGLIFTFFVFANYLMRTVQPSWPPPGVARLEVAIPAAISLILLASWFTGSRSLAAIRRDDANGMAHNALITALLGTMFLVGLSVACTQIPYSGPYSSIVLVMNGFHAFHALIGVGLLAYTYFNRQRYSQHRYFMVEGSAVFWQFVVLMWVFFFVVIYLA